MKSCIHHTDKTDDFDFFHTNGLERRNDKRARKGADTFFGKGQILLK